MLTAPGQGLHGEPPASHGLLQLVVTLRRLSRLLTALEDQARYGGPAMLSLSFGRIGELVEEAERLALAGARLPSAERPPGPAVSAADLVAGIGGAFRFADANIVGSARWWLAVHALGRRTEEAHRYVAGLVDPNSGSR